MTGFFSVLLTNQSVFSTHTTSKICSAVNLLPDAYFNE